ncbi:MAG: hypothetical protein ACM3JH_02490 [Acidithiobacillales bacterium]
MRRRAVLLLPLAAVLSGCSSLSTPLPLISTPPPAPLSSSVFEGRARAYRFVGGAWVAAPEDDYDFIVLEQRYADHWEAVKEIHRRNPKYGGRAGPRDQTLYFSVRMSLAKDGHDLVVESSEGNGTGHETAAGFVFELAYAHRGWFVPFDTIRIVQERSAGEGRLREIVELLSKKKGGETPFMKMEEEGLVYRPVGR